MKEVEIKAHLRDKKEIMKRLSALGCSFSAPVRQEDSVYTIHAGSLEKFRTNDVFLRIRIKDGKKVLFTLKKPIANDLDALEHELEISAKKPMEDALFLMGYQEAIRINKVRIITEYDGCEICIDEVDGLGSFIEMEKLTKEGDSEAIQEEMFTFFESIGISKQDRIRFGYDVLMFEAKERKSK